jgi:hypothetical protein
MTELRLERWKSSEEHQEVHFFIADSQIYVFGFNPDLVEESDVVGFLLEMGFQIGGE